ncbi:MAG: ribonuclease HII [Proteobacteria bacterium]|nr:ribonuclease HII [Pseudomonadota bacterium]
MVTKRKDSRPDFALEDSCKGIVCGIDEAGRAPLAGPVMAACVFIPEDKRGLKFLDAVNDSKKVVKPRREELFSLITEYFHWGAGMASPEEIDALNIHHATLLAMKRAFDAMRGVKAAVALVDGKFAPALSCATQTVIRGDAISKSIAAASIVAKVTRDRLMEALHKEFPHYGWDRNAAYPTPEHLEAIRLHGLTPHHRRSFAPCAQASLPLRQSISR